MFFIFFYCHVKCLSSFTTIFLIFFNISISADKLKKMYSLALYCLKETHKISNTKFYIEYIHFACCSSVLIIFLKHVHFLIPMYVPVVKMETAFWMHKHITIFEKTFEFWWSLVFIIRIQRIFWRYDFWSLRLELLYSSSVHSIKLSMWRSNN